MPVDRRSFLQSALTLGAAVCVAPRLRALGSLHRVSVADFGADATGKKDSTAAVRKAIAALAPANARLVFPAGRYVFEASDEAAMQFDKFDGIEVYANNAELHFAGTTTAFGFTGCHNVALHDLKLDWAPGDVAAEKLPLAHPRSVSFDECEGVLLEGLTVQRAPGIGFAASNCRDMRFDGVIVAPAKATHGQQSSAGHAIEISNCHGDIKLHGCRLEGMGGDGVRIQQSYWRIRERLDERSVVIESTAQKPLETAELPLAGSFVQFSSPETLLLLGEIAISSVATNPLGATLNFSETLSPVILSGMLVCSVVDGPKVAIDHCTIDGNLGHGVVLHARSEVTNNHFTGCGGAAILLAPDARRMEGPVVQNVNIRGNTFSGCNQGPGAEARGVITIDTAQDREHAATPAFAVNSGIKIQTNIFKETAGPAVYAAGVDGLLIEGNTFGCVKPPDAKGPLTAAMVLRNVADADVTGNTASIAQSIVMVQCAASIQTEGNRLLTAEKSA